MWPGQRFGLKVEKVLHSARSEFQDLLVFESSTWGRVLVLDGVIQCTEKDQCSYQEMIAHLGLCAYGEEGGSDGEAARRVLVVGGGDGGVVREAVKHASVEEIHLCELDRSVVEVSKEHLPFMSEALDDKRVEIFYEDGAAFLRRRAAYYDVIIVDSSDPVGPAETLFEESFIASLYAGLRDPRRGVVVTQGECAWLHGELISSVLGRARKAGFASAQYAWCSVPSYPCGTIGFCVLSGHDCSKARREVGVTQFYSKEMHEASFVLPPFLKKMLE